MNSKLPDVLNFNENDIDWFKCHEFALSNLVKEAANLWNDNMSIRDTAKKLHLHESTVSRYLKMATKLNWCNWYNGIGHVNHGLKMTGAKHHCAKRVIRLCDEVIYDTITQATTDNNMARSTMDRRLKEQRGFMYYDEYLLLQELNSNGDE